MTGVESSSIVSASLIPLNVDPIFIGLPTDLSIIGNNPFVLAHVIELLKSHGNVLHSLSAVELSSHRLYFMQDLLLANVDHSGFWIMKIILIVVMKMI